MKSRSGKANTGSDAASPIVKTYGEILLDGSVLDAVISATGDRLDLVFFDGKSTVIAPEIKHGGRIYQVQELPPSILQATRLPREPVDYGTVR